MKYLSVQREKSRKYSQSWQRQHAADELKTVAAAVNYLSEHGISTLDELDAALSSVSEQADAIREGMKTAEKRMKELQKLIEYGKNYTEYKPIHDELKKLKNGWTSKRDKYEEAHRAELTLGEYDITADELLSGAGGNTATKTEQAEKLIFDLLADGKELASEDIVKAAAGAGISERTVKNARRNLDTQIEVIRRGNQWYYRRNEAKSAK